MERTERRLFDARRLWLGLLLMMVTVFMCVPGVFAASRFTGYQASTVNTGDGIYAPKRTYTVVTRYKKGKKVKKAFGTWNDGTGKHRYYFDKKGNAVHGEVVWYDGMQPVRFLKLVKIKGSTYAFDEKGHIVTGVQVVMGKTMGDYNFDSGKLYYFGKKGRMNKAKTKALQKVTRKGYNYSKFLKTLARYKVRPVGQMTYTGTDCLYVKGISGWPEGFEVKFKDFVLKGEANQQKTVFVVYNLKNLV